MPALILYLLKANATLTLFYLAYFFLLRRLTFYSLNRLFLAWAIVFAAATPLLEFPGLLPRQEQLNNSLAGMALGWRQMQAEPVAAHVSLLSPWQLALLLFWSGAAVVLGRLGIQLLSLRRLHRQSMPARHSGVTFRSIRERVNPFSFWQLIYLNPKNHQEEELLPILRHEQVHVTGWHTLDVLLVESSMLLYWFNPAAWLMKRALKQNLEFIADREVLQTGFDRKVYQYSLVRISSLPQGSTLSNNFNFLTIKNRIAMMNKTKSSWMHAARYAVLAPIIATPMLLFTACSEETTMPEFDPQADTQAASPDSIVYYVDGEIAKGDAYTSIDPKEILSVNVVKSEKAMSAFGGKDTKGIVSIITKKHASDPQTIRFNEELKALTPPAAAQESN